MTSESCYVCGADTCPRRVGIAEMLVCPTCGLGRLVDSPRGSEYWTRGGNVDEELAERYWTTARSAVFRNALQRVAAQVGAGRLVDLGGGVGHFAKCALDMGWDAYSMDVSELASSTAASRIGTDRALTSFPTALEGTCDAVTLWCVVAHVPDPRSVIEDALRLLRPGGCLLITTPNFLFQARYASALARLGRPMDFEAHDHFFHFTPSALSRLLTDAKVERWRFTYLGITEDCLLNRGWAQWLVPAKRVWNVMGTNMTRLGLPQVSSELQVLAVKQAV